jgi:2'-5' RNA ligase
MKPTTDNPTLFNLPKIEKYSIAICPPDNIVLLVKEYKQRLSKAIGRGYPSLNADAHISFETFNADTEMLKPIEQYLEKFCLAQEPFEIHLLGTDTFHFGTFYIAVENPSRGILRSLMATVNNSLFKKNLDADSYVPHMSVARSQLTKQELAIAKDLITGVDLKFICDNIAIRKFDPAKQQYDVYKRFWFNGRSPGS